MNQTMKYWKQAVAGALCLLTLAGCAGQSGGGTMSQPESSSELSLGDGPIRIVRSDKNPLPWQSETTYEYLGLRFFLPEEFQAGIEDGSLYLQREALYNSDDKTRDQFYYAYQYLQYIPEDCEDMEYAVDWNAWLDTTERIGAVGAYRADYLEELLRKQGDRAQRGRTAHLLYQRRCGGPRGAGGALAEHGGGADRGISLCSGA